jgi:hypothetical protein
MDPLKRRYKNRILSALPKTEIESLERHLTPVTLKKKSILCCWTIPCREWTAAWLPTPSRPTRRMFPL